MLIQAGFQEMNGLGRAVHYGRIVSKEKAEEVYAIYKIIVPGQKKEADKAVRKKWCESVYACLRLPRIMRIISGAKAKAASNYES